MDRLPAGHPAVAFMHIPKTAGTSLVLALRRALAPAASVGGFDASLFGDYADFDTFDAPTRAAIHLRPHDLPPADFVAGHFALSTLMGRYPRARLLSVLREPRSRLLSLWLFWRSHSDEQLAGWGTWADRVRLARLPLAAFLRAPAVACQTDNMITRALLWPHPLIPDGGFIAPDDEAWLLTDARRRLAQLSFVDVVEVAGWEARLQAWLGRPLDLARCNETTPMPRGLRGDLARELTASAFDALAARSRIDTQLWTTVAGGLAGSDADAVREEAWIRTVARHAPLLAGGTPAMA
ncbi:hypothetical protein [Acidisphaera rubrifaciens]|uniref:Sulfotransferase n=1 Tax=Acidisphaera rubrifaciens HS-AP3 TaxID=1231350 RepID=A0A0D6P2L9_9PROT|nr:hypothetical protein [Acidisphaera rubrifaciens]GAN75912.1 hypothetical protein Asru_0023_02 [Acidisphaera rubrifaciens HS-AP3]